MFYQSLVLLGILFLVIGAIVYWRMDREKKRYELASEVRKTPGFSDLEKLLVRAEGKHFKRKCSEGILFQMIFAAKTADELLQAATHTHTSKAMCERALFLLYEKKTQFKVSPDHFVKAYKLAKKEGLKEVAAEMLLHVRETWENFPT